jgi:Domain of unknown function (DUF1840)
MLVTFRSTATETITMFENVAVDLLKLMGASGRIPGALAPEDVPPALQRLERSIEQAQIGSHAETPARPADNEDWTDEEEDERREPPVAIATRAVPLISLMRRAAAANAEVMWEGK